MPTNHLSPVAPDPNPTDPDTTSADGHRPRKCIVLVRHGQTTFNVEKRLPGQLPGIALTEEGQRQAIRAAVALSGLPLARIVSSPLERAYDTAVLIARGWGLTVRTDDRLMDTDVGHWSGQKLDDVANNDPDWKRFVAHGSQPPEGVESLAHVLQRAVAVVEDIRYDPQPGEYVVVVAHADVIKLIVAHYLGIEVDCAHFINIDNASLSALAFGDDGPPVLLALNWNASPGWLFARAHQNAPTPTGASTTPTSDNGTHPPLT